MEYILEHLGLIVICILIGFGLALVVSLSFLEKGIYEEYKKTEDHRYRDRDGGRIVK